MTRHRPRRRFRPMGRNAPCVPVYRQLTGDGLTPVSAFGRIERAAPSFLFESVIGGEKVGRFSFLGTEPFLRFEARGDEVVVTVQPETLGRTAFTLRPIRSATSSNWSTSIAPFPSRASPVRRRRGRLCGLRRRPLHREPARRAARRSRPARPLVRVLRPDGAVRPHPQDHPGRRPGARRARGRPPRGLRVGL